MCERYSWWGGGGLLGKRGEERGGRRGEEGCVWWAHLNCHCVSSLGFLSGMNPMISPQNCGKHIFGFATKCLIFGFATETVHYGRPPNGAFAAHLGVCKVRVARSISTTESLEADCTNSSFVYKSSCAVSAQQYLCTLTNTGIAIMQSWTAEPDHKTLMCMVLIIAC